MKSLAFLLSATLAQAQLDTRLTMKNDADKDGTPDLLEHLTGGHPYAQTQAENQSGKAVVLDVGTVSRYLHVQRFRGQPTNWPENTRISLSRNLRPPTMGAMGGHTYTATLEWSADLQTWTQGQFAATSLIAPINHGDGTTSVAALSPFYAQSDTSVSSLTWTVTHPIDAVRINGSVVVLPSYPYPLPAQATTLIAHLLSAGHAASIDLSGSLPVLRIDAVYASPFTSADHTLLLNGNQVPASQSGTAPDGTPILNKQFSRLKLTP